MPITFLQNVETLHIWKNILENFKNLLYLNNPAAENHEFAYPSALNSHTSYVVVVVVVIIIFHNRNQISSQYIIAISNSERKNSGLFGEKRNNYISSQHLLTGDDKNKNTKSCLYIHRQIKSHGFRKNGRE